jgi:hypothetical protein
MKVFGVATSRPGIATDDLGDLTQVCGRPFPHARRALPRAWVASHLQLARRHACLGDATQQPRRVSRALGRPLPAAHVPRPTCRVAAPSAFPGTARPLGRITRVVLCAHRASLVARPECIGAVSMIVRRFSECLLCAVLCDSGERRALSLAVSSRFVTRREPLACRPRRLVTPPSYSPRQGHDRHWGSEGSLRRAIGHTTLCNPHGSRCARRCFSKKSRATAGQRSAFQAGT